MSVPANAHRSQLREAQVIFRCTAEDREVIKNEALRHGLTMQAYLEMRILNRENVTELQPGRPAKPQNELPLTG